MVDPRKIYMYILYHLQNCIVDGDADGDMKIDREEFFYFLEHGCKKPK